MQGSSGRPAITKATEETEGTQPLRFSMKALLLTTTAICIVAAALSRLIEPRYQIGVWIMVAVYAVVGAMLYRQVKSQRRRIEGISRHGIVVRVDAKWAKRVKSPWFMLIAALTGVSTTFAPLCLLWCGSDYRSYETLEWVLVPACLMTIYLVPGFYMRLAGEVLQQLAEFNKGVNNEPQTEAPPDELAT